MFISEQTLDNCTWQAFERIICRLLIHGGFDNVRLVGTSSDGGADIICNKAGKRWLVQVKKWNQPVSVNVVDETIRALVAYRAQVPVVVSLNGFSNRVYELHRELLGRKIPIQLWDKKELLRRAELLTDDYPSILEGKKARQYQEEAIRVIVNEYLHSSSNKAMVVMATGLGKTFVASETIRRINQGDGPKRVFVIVHTNELVYQIEKSFWPFIKSSQNTLIWNGYEKPSIEDIGKTQYLFACLNTVSEHIKKGGEIPPFDIILIDECHHVGGQMYLSILEETRAGKENGPFLLGLTATPWRADTVKIDTFFGSPLVCVDMVSGLRNGFLTNVDYRMFTDNINWESLRKLEGKEFTPKAINRTFFISEWDDAVILALKKVWTEQYCPKAIVFCGTIDHAITMRDKINALGFCNAAAIYSQTTRGHSMKPYERNRVMCDFQDGVINVICVVDIFNEGVDVPDANIIVFQRVTHSRRIFVQQLGRGLRIAKEKDTVIVLDFVSDIRRFAAGLTLKDDLMSSGKDRGVRVNVNHKVSFKKTGGDDPKTESFLREWLEDVAAVESSGDDASVLKYPPKLTG